MSGLRERWLLWRFNRQAVYRYMHMRPRSRWCRRRLCGTCARRWVTGQMRTAKIAERERYRATRASASWWPLGEVQTTVSGHRYRQRIRPWEYEDYQRWLAERTAK